jgi:hypothetical protein
MGAAWKVRTNLNNSLGNQTGDLVANAIFLGWMNGYNQTQIKSIIETQWLTLDDSDGNINNGTPHYAEINNGFVAQGFPGVQLLPVSITNVTNLPDTTNQIGPYTVNATIIANQVPPLTVTQLKYRINGGAYQTVNMTVTTGDNYTATIPGQLAPTRVEYYITATNSGSTTQVFPLNGSNVPLDFDVGIVHPIVGFSFEEATDMGWTTASSPARRTTGNAAIRPARSAPAGRSDRGQHGHELLGHGSRQWRRERRIRREPELVPADARAELHRPVERAPAFQPLALVPGLGSDQARIFVNGTQFYTNPSTNMNDGTWTAQDINISSVANNNPSVQIEWRITSNSTTNYGGWNIDDVRLLAIEVPCPSPTSYCVTSPNSVGPGALMQWQGEPRSASTTSS